MPAAYLLLSLIAASGSLPCGHCAKGFISDFSNLFELRGKNIIKKAHFLLEKRAISGMIPNVLR